MLPEQQKFGHFLEKSEDQKSERGIHKDLLVEVLSDFRLIGGAIFDIWVRTPLREKIQSSKHIKTL